MSQCRAPNHWKGTPNWRSGFSILLPTPSSLPNHSGTIVRWNRASSALFGHAAEDAIGKSIDLIIPEHLRAAHWAGFDAAMTKGVMKLQGRPTVTRAVHKDGRRLYIEMTFAIVRGALDSEILGSVAMARDVTERVEKERAARRSA